MRCQILSEHLSAYIDGIVDSPLAYEIEEHLRHCSTCRLEYEELNAVIKLVRDLPEVTPLPGFHTGLQQRLQQLPPPVSAASSTKPFFQRWLGVLAVAAVLGIIFGATAIWSQQFKSLMLSFVAMGGPSTTEQAAQNREPLINEINALLAENDKGKANANDEVLAPQVTKDIKADDELLQGSEQKSNMNRLAPTPELKPAPLSTGAGAPSPSPTSLPTPEQKKIPDEKQESSSSGHEHPNSWLMMSDAAPAEMEAKQKPGEEQLKQAESKIVLETRSLVALEYTVTLKTKSDMEQSAIDAKINSLVGQHQGFVNNSHPVGGAKIMVCLPPSQAEPLIEAIKQLGQVEYQQYNQDLTEEYLLVQNKFLDLLRQEQVMAATLEQQKTANLAQRQELVRLDEQIKQQQKILSNLNQRIEQAKIELLIIRP